MGSVSAGIACIVDAGWSFAAGTPRPDQKKILESMAGRFQGDTVVRDTFLPLAATPPQTASAA